MKLVSSEFDKNDKSIQAVAARNEVLNKSIDAQKEKISTLEAALKNASESFGENDRRTQNWAIQLNNAKAELNGMERELEESTDSTDELGDELKETGEEAEKSGGKFEKLGGVLKGIGVAMGAVAIAAGLLQFKMKEVVQQFGELEQTLALELFLAHSRVNSKIREEAYKILGVSQSEYLATAIKMGALCQVSGSNSAKALADRKPCSGRRYGIRYGYRYGVGFGSGHSSAKATLPDGQLGVAMNATSVQAYAASKGLDFVWQARALRKAEVAMPDVLRKQRAATQGTLRENPHRQSAALRLLQAALGSLRADWETPTLI
jgi:hypothetical protein